MSCPAEKCLPGAGEHDDLDLVVVDRALERAVERVGHHRVLRVAVLGPVHRHDRRRAPHLVPHRLVVVMLYSSRRTLFRTLPDGLRGSASTNSTRRGTL